MSQEVKGNFTLKLRGVPGLLVSRLTLMSLKGYVVQGRAVHFGPIVFGYVLPERKKR